MKIEAKFSIILLFWYTEFIFHFFVNNRALSSLQVTINLPVSYSFVYLGGVPTYSLAPCVVFNIHCNLDMLLRVGQPWVWPQGCSKGNIRGSHLKESGYSLLFLHCNDSARGRKVIISWQDFLFFSFILFQQPYLWTPVTEPTSLLNPSVTFYHTICSLLSNTRSGAYLLWCQSCKVKSGAYLR